MELTHINDQGRARMVDVSDKDDTERIAVAKGYIYMKEDTLKAVNNGRIKKGDVLSVAQVGGIMGSKNTPFIIPMCHPIMITGCDISFLINFEKLRIEITATTKTLGKTGIEMEALTAVSVAALTIYDMCKAIDREMIISDIMLMKKSGGKSGVFERIKGRVYDLKISDEKGKTPKSQESILIAENEGIKGDVHREDINRQVSFFTYEGIQKLKESEISGLCTEKFWGNIITEGIEFSELTLGTKFKIGEALIEITAKGKNCYKDCELSQNGSNCVIPMETSFGRIIKGGRVHIEDSIEVLDY